MAKVKFGRWEYTDEELERQFEEATKRGEEAEHSEPRAKSVHYDRTSNRLVIELTNGATFIVPCELLQGLRDASPEDIAGVKLGPRGAALFWDKLDVDFSLPGLMAGRFGNKAWMAELGRQGVRAKLETKPPAAPVNKKKSGRPLQEQKRLARKA